MSEHQPHDFLRSMRAAQRARERRAYARAQGRKRLHASMEAAEREAREASSLAARERQRAERFRAQSARLGDLLRELESGAPVTEEPGTVRLGPSAPPSIPVLPITPQEEARAFWRYYEPEAFSAPVPPVVPAKPFLRTPARPMTAAESARVRQVEGTLRFYRDLYPQLSPQELYELALRHYAQFPGEFTPGEELLRAASGVSGPITGALYTSWNETNFTYYQGGNPLGAAYRYIASLPANDRIYVVVYGILSPDARVVYDGIIDINGELWGYVSMGVTMFGNTLVRAFPLKALDMRNRFTHIERVTVRVLRSNPT